MHTAALKHPLFFEHALEKRVRLIATALVIVFALLYAYFVSSSVLHVIARKEASAEMVRTQSAIAQLESEYFAFSERVSAAGAERLGLAPIGQKQFVTRTVHAQAYASESDF